MIGPGQTESSLWLFPTRIALDMAAVSMNMSSPDFDRILSSSDSNTRSSSSSSNTNNNSLFGLLKNMQPPAIPATDNQLEHLFEDEYVANGPSWGARICYGTGMTYIVGLATGGLWGFVDGMRHPAGKTSNRLRFNCILNSCTARGPFLGNNMGMLALLYNLIHGGVIKARNGQYDLYSSVGSATLAGVVYKSTAGVRPMGMAGLLFGSGMLCYQLAKQYHEEGFINLGPIL